MKFLKDAEKSFNKNPTIFHDENIQQTGHRKKLPKPVKECLQNKQTNKNLTYNIVNSKRLNSFFLRSGTM